MIRPIIAIAGVSAAIAMAVVVEPAMASPTATAALKCTASVTNARPADNTTTDVKVRAAAGAEVFTVAHYKSVNRAYFRTASSAGRATIAYDVSGATPGFKVTVGVTVVTGHQANSCSTSFTPRR